MFAKILAQIFKQNLQFLGPTDPRFVSRLTSHWLYITRKWAVHAEPGSVHFGNVTNNYLKNALSHENALHLQFIAMDDLGGSLTSSGYADIRAEFNYYILASRCLPKWNH
ncbi:hypothetical protein CSKR_104407 [Clonorchis sinensis]|uniref:Uncharacterized protein n=1 Tax=Clonorchis sinensis TaxID=79923 RepID=A0A419PLJ9_CLOSI|nr:hypothetical protein CSKR_104407 [Clonorchis sinensis]